MEDMEIKFGRNLLTMRSRLGLSQQEIADQIHVTRQTISLWERGQGKPDIYYLRDLCSLFRVSADTFLFGNVLCDDLLPYKSLREAVESLNLPEIGYIEGLDQKGFVTINDEDLYDFFEIIPIEIEEILTMSLILHKKGYKIMEIFDNGFSVFFRTDEEAKNFHNDIFEIMEGFVHHHEEYLVDRREHFEGIMGSIKHECIMEAMAEILGKRPNEFKYYWVDMSENPRGYADTEEECRKQAKEQECEKYRIFPIV